ncbi:glutathione S-transferase family protein [Mesobacterium sp. TK19101]|uniref:Glutathione S-transferase family protein n=1 Tax=Mesobacterium hydrothermale TaxID=3111907 RepID=A0ABU6HC26_9RHOB|nr:glutathione S-transferase family protein [Mesobacterium sp. TK19101]MEC3860023.1 glutathione S-transferase family protein [Mesobacterium sp. TK19101]
MTEPRPRLHHVPFSRSFRTLWLLEELGIDAEIVPHDIRAGDMRDPVYRAKSPAGRVPALEIDGRTLFESGAICEYLAETRGTLGRAPGHPERADYLTAIHYAETMAGLVEQLNLSRIFLRPPAQPSIPVLKITTARLRATLDGLEAMLEARDHALASGFSAADTMMGFNLFAVPYYVRLDPYPNVAAYRARLEARPAFQAARAKDGPQTFYRQEFYPIPEDSQ